ncbi:MAG: biopolymer transporter ExbB [Planctomycetes bacterium RBG_16_64_12]|nr:MAG: biopolymer transporter ExbB [Planctomycetes bacterium RBG_16_64_12]
MDMTAVTEIVGYVIYGALALIALWGAFCVVIVWRRIAQTRFRSEQEQSEFLDGLEQNLAAGDFDGALELCSGDNRAMPQLVMLALANRHVGYAKIRSLLSDRFQRDVLSDLEYRLTWVYTVIKSAPMLGLFGTVVGMMGAFSQLAAGRGETVDPALLADNISLALITTVCGLAIAIPLVLCTASINVRIRKLEDLVGSGSTRFLESFKTALERVSAAKR